jgi:hypothetical protein
VDWADPQEEAPEEDQLAVLVGVLQEAERAVVLLEALGEVAAAALPVAEQAAVLLAVLEAGLQEVVQAVALLEALEEVAAAALPVAEQAAVLLAVLEAGLQEVVQAVALLEELAEVLQAVVRVVDLLVARAEVPVVVVRVEVRWADLARFQRDAFESSLDRSREEEVRLEEVREEDLLAVLGVLVVVDLLEVALVEAQQEGQGEATVAVLLEEV